jgi:hypothetical protein
MYYRRKILLALVETFGGKLQRTDCQKLLLLFCQHTGQNHYDFFPYKYGGFSFLVYRDKERLEQMGLLTGGEDFHIKDSSSFINEINPEDKLAMRLLATEHGNLRGNPLIRQTYIEFPQYTCNSEIITQILSTSEIENTRQAWNTETAPCLFTIGYEGLTIDAYLNKLIVNNIKVVVDVRRIPNSMKYGFSKSKLQSYVNKAGMDYIHIPELGIPTNMRQNLDSADAYDALFRHYENEILPKQTIALEIIITEIEKHKRVALTCLEANHRMCHRHKVVEYLTKNPEFSVDTKHL